MNTMLKIFRYEMRDVLRGRWLVAYTVFFLVLTEALLRFGGSGDRALLSLMNIVLIVIPLMSIVFGTMYCYGAREFTELLLAQPVGRPQLFAGLYLGLAVPLAIAFAAGVALPFLGRGPFNAGGIMLTLATLLAVGIALTFAFTAIAFLVAVRVTDRARGLGMAVLLWLLLAVVYDGLVLLVATAFGDYPVEPVLLGLMIANPLDLGRMLLLTSFDAGALMGYTGAVFQRFFGSAVGAATATAALLLWFGVPFALGLRAFGRRDF